MFEAPSLTKPLVSFIALQLAEQGTLDLAAPLPGPHASLDWLQVASTLQGP